MPMDTNSPEKEVAVNVLYSHGDKDSFHNQRTHELTKLKPGDRFLPH